MCKTCSISRTFLLWEPRGNAKSIGFNFCWHMRVNKCGVGTLSRATAEVKHNFSGLNNLYMKNIMTPPYKEANLVPWTPPQEVLIRTRPTKVDDKFMGNTRLFPCKFIQFQEPLPESFRAELLNIAQNSLRDVVGKC